MRQMQIFLSSRILSRNISLNRSVYSSIMMSHLLRARSSQIRSMTLSQKIALKNSSLYSSRYMPVRRRIENEKPNTDISWTYHDELMRSSSVLSSTLLRSMSMMQSDEIRSMERSVSEHMSHIDSSGLFSGDGF